VVRTNDAPINVKPLGKWGRPGIGGVVGTFDHSPSPEILAVPTTSLINSF